jgi:hypothetical protein
LRLAPYPQSLRGASAPASALPPLSRAPAMAASESEVAAARAGASSAATSALQPLVADYERAFVGVAAGQAALQARLEALLGSGKRNCRGLASTGHRDELALDQRARGAAAGGAEGAPASRPRGGRDQGAARLAGQGAPEPFLPLPSPTALPHSLSPSSRTAARLAGWPRWGKRWSRTWTPWRGPTRGCWGRWIGRTSGSKGRGYCSASRRGSGGCGGTGNEGGRSRWRHGGHALSHGTERRGRPCGCERMWRHGSSWQGPLARQRRQEQWTTPAKDV